MRFLYVLIFILIGQNFSAQEESAYSYGVFNFEENKTQKIFTDWTRIRKEPNINADILDSLRTNQPITILKLDETVLKLRGRASRWYKVAYDKEGTNAEGYVWGGNLSIGFRNKNGFDFLFGITKSTEKNIDKSSEKYFVNIGTIKVLENNELIDEVNFQTGSGESLSTGEFKIESGHLLKNVEFTLRAGVSGEACGIDSFTHYVLFANRKLVLLPTLTNMGDADVFYHSEEYVFPNDKGGKPNTILFKMEEMEKDEKDKEHYKRSKTTYIWNGEKMMKK